MVLTQLTGENFKKLHLNLLEVVLNRFKPMTHSP